MVRKISSPGILSGKYLFFSIRRGGSVTIEAAFLLPVVLMVLFLWIRVFEIMEFQLNFQFGIQDGMQKIAEIKTYGEDYSLGETGSGVINAAAGRILLENVEEKYWDHPIVRNGKNGITTRVEESRDGLQIVYRYKVDFPMIPEHFLLSVQQIVFQKYCWGNSVKDVEALPYVYVTEHGEAYHIQRNCSSIQRRITYCLKEELEEIRSSNGARYYPCEICGIRDQKGYYVSHYGTRYHVSLTCPNMQRKVRLVELDMVGDRTLCRICGKDEFWYKGS